MRTALAAVVTLGLVTFLAMPALAAPAPAPAPKAAAPVGPGALFVESEDGGATKLVLSGQVRTVWDSFRNLDDFKTSNGRNYREFIDTRAELGFLFQLNDAEVFLQPQVNYVWGGRQIDSVDGDVQDAGNDNLRIYQAWVAMHPEILGMTTVVKIGRQELAFGSGMILGNNARYNGLSFDAARLDIKPLDGLTTSLFGAKVVENDRAYVDGSSSGAYSIDEASKVYLYGLYNTLVLNKMDTTIDFYGLLFQAEHGIAGATVGDYNGVGLVETDLFTLGARVAIKPIELLDKHAADFDFAFEVATQFGTIGGGPDHHNVTRAYAIESELGLTLGALPLSPRLALGVAVATGDKDTDGKDVHAFQPLFEDTTNRLGDADLVSLSNLQCLYLKASVKPTEKTEIGAAYYRFDAIHEETAVGGYNLTQPANGTGALDSGPGLNKDDGKVADEIDLYADYKMTKNVSLRGVFAWVDPSEYIHDKAGYSNSSGNRLFGLITVKW